MWLFVSVSSRTASSHLRWTTEEGAAEKLTSIIFHSDFYSYIVEASIASVLPNTLLMFTKPCFIATSLKRSIKILFLRPLEKRQLPSSGTLSMKPIATFNLAENLSFSNTLCNLWRKVCQPSVSNTCLKIVCLTFCFTQSTWKCLQASGSSFKHPISNSPKDMPRPIFWFLIHVLRCVRSVCVFWRKFYKQLNDDEVDNYVVSFWL